MLSRLVITFLPRSKCLLISWLQSPSAVILEPQKIVWHCFHCFPIYLPWSDGTRHHAHQTPTRAYCLQQTVQTIVHFAIERILNLFLKSLSALLPQLFPKLARIFCCTQIVFLLLIPLPRLHPKEEGSNVEIIAFNGEKDGWRVGSSPFILQPMLTTCQALFHTQFNLILTMTLRAEHNYYPHWWICLRVFTLKQLILPPNEQNVKRKKKKLYWNTVNFSPCSPRAPRVTQFLTWYDCLL